MSRQQTNKSNRDKGASRGGAGSQPAPVPTVSTDVVPGRMSASEWGKICSTDDSDEFIGSIVEDILEITLDKCYEKYILKQLIPFTVYKAKDELLSLIEWRFLSHDIGEENIQVSHSWAEDAEPDPGIIDSWAQGSVPIIVKRQPEPEVQQVVVEEEPDKEDEVQTIDDATETISLGTGLETQVTEEAKSQTPRKDEKPKPPEKKPIKKKIKYKKYTGRLPSAHVSAMGETIEQSESQLMEREMSALDVNKSPGSHLPLSQKSFLKLQAGRPPGNKEVTFDEKGNVVAVMKLDTRSFPTHRVRVGYQIVDPEAEAAAQRLEAMRTGKLRRLTQIQWKPKPVKTRLSPRRYMEEKPTEEKPKAKYPLPPLHRRNTTGRYRRASVNASRHRNIPASRRLHQDSFVEPLPPSLIDSIDASPGVVITEGDQVKVGSRTKSPSSQVRAPVLSDDGSIVGSVTVSVKGSRTLRYLGGEAASSSSTNEGGIRPVLNPSQVIAGSPTVTSPFSVRQVISQTSNQVLTLS